MILGTVDGGSHWRTMNSGVKSNLEFVQFLDARTGWAVGLGGALLSTSDGGSTWQAHHATLR
jgi:photosystem II stability/assembly factor-like uncharacterized protein